MIGVVWHDTWLSNVSLLAEFHIVTGVVNKGTTLYARVLEFQRGASINMALMSELL